MMEFMALLIIINEVIYDTDLTVSRFFMQYHWPDLVLLFNS